MAGAGEGEVTAEVQNNSESTGEAKVQGGTKGRGAGARSYAVDPEKLQEKIDLLNDLPQGAGLTERANQLKLPLMFPSSDHGPQKKDKFGPLKQDIFASALAELTVHFAEKADTFRFVMESQFGATLTKKFLGLQPPGFRSDAKYTKSEIRRLISLAFPWYNNHIFMDLLRINNPESYKMNEYAELPGHYRFFRTRPMDDGSLAFSDGQIKIEINEDDNVICFGQVSANFVGCNIFAGEYEHRGFVIPGRDKKIDVISFRGGTIRMSSFVRTVNNSYVSNGITLTTARSKDDRIKNRPFAARFIMVKEGHSLYNISLPAGLPENDTTEQQKQRNEVLREFNNYVGGTVFETDGFMWGNKT